VDTLLRHFGSLKELERASFQELRQFLTRREAEAVIAGLSMSSVVDTEEAVFPHSDLGPSSERALLSIIRAVWFSPLNSLPETSGLPWQRGQSNVSMGMRAILSTGRRLPEGRTCSTSHFFIDAELDKACNLRVAQRPSTKGVLFAPGDIDVTSDVTSFISIYSPDNALTFCTAAHH
jgi:hypothetical protein